MADTFSEIKDDVEDTGEGMKRGAKKTGHRWTKALKKQKTK